MSLISTSTSPLPPFTRSPRSGEVWLAPLVPPSSPSKREGCNSPSSAYSNSIASNESISSSTQLLRNEANNALLSVVARNGKYRLAQRTHELLRLCTPPCFCTPVLSRYFGNELSDPVRIPGHRPSSHESLGRIQGYSRPLQRPSALDATWDLRHFTWCLFIHWSKEPNPYLPSWTLNSHPYVSPSRSTECTEILRISHTSPRVMIANTANISP